MLKKSLNVNTNILPQGLEARSHAGMAWKNTLGIVTAPAFERTMYDAQSLSNGIPTGMSYTRATTASYVAASGKLMNMGAASGVLRHDYDSITGEYKGILLEPAATNICLQSEVSGTTWTATNCTLSANSTISPDWSLSADTLQATATGMCSIAQVITVTASMNYTFSVYLKAGTSSWGYIQIQDGASHGRRQYVNLTTGKLGSSEILISDFTTFNGSTITPMYNGWYRVSISVGAMANTSFTVATGPCISDLVWVGTTAGLNVIWWGAQLETGIMPTSYISTTTAAFTRNADLLNILTSTFGFNGYEGTMYVEGGVPCLTTAPHILACMDDTSTANNFYQYLMNSSLGGYIGTGSAQQMNQSFTPVYGQTMYRHALAYAANNANVSLNGIIGTPKTTGVALPAIGVITTLRLGATTGTQSAVWVKHFAYFPRRLSDSDLIKLTT